MGCRVEWELWTSSNDGCGNSCDIQLRFKKAFRDTAMQLEEVIYRRLQAKGILTASSAQGPASGVLTIQAYLLSL